jgi:hypothetical protein
VKKEYKKLRLRMYLAELHYGEAVGLRRWKDAALQATIMADTCLEIQHLMKRSKKAAA